MAKKASKSAAKPSGTKSKEDAGSAQFHRKRAAELHAQARLHDAKADLADAKNPPKPVKWSGRGYPC